MSVPLEGGAGREDVVPHLRVVALHLAQGVAFLLDDLVDVLVPVARLLEELLEGGRIVDALRRELPQPAG